MGILKRILGNRQASAPFCSAVIVAAGNAARMLGTDKMMAELSGTPVICHTAAALEACPLINEIVIVTREDLIVEIGRLCKEFGFSKVNKIVVGGQTRTESVQRGLDEVSRDAQLIAIHDGARPFVSQALLEEVIRKAERCNAAAPAVPLKDTVKQAEQGRVLRTLERSALFAVQTPQVFEASLIRAAIHKTIEDGAELTDDCAAVERLGMTVCLTTGSYDNIKITTPGDLVFGQALLDRLAETEDEP